MAWQFASYGMTDFKRWMLLRAKERCKNNLVPMEYGNLCKKFEANIDEVRMPNFFGIQLAWYKFRSFAKVGVVQRTHPHEMIMEWRKAVRWTYMHPCRNTEVVSNLFGFEHLRKVKNIRAPYEKEFVCEKLTAYPDGITKHLETMMVIKLVDSIGSKHRVIRSIQGTGGMIEHNTLLYQRTEDNHF